jgi:hypothetical protein
LLVVLILIVLGVHSCQVSQRNSGLKDYTDNVASLIRSSNQTSQQLFGVLTSGQGAGNATNLQSQVNQARLSADNQLSKARGTSVPDEMKRAHQNLLLALQMRRDGIADIAQQIQPALGSATSKDAVNGIATAMARFYASDVLYKAYALPSIAGALHAAGITVGGPDGEQLDPGQFLPDVQWVTPSFIASQLRVSLPSASGKPAPGLHGHELSSVSAGGNTLDPSSTNTLSANPPPSFTLTFTNSGQNTETNVTCKVSVSGTNVSGQAVVQQTQASQQYTCQVPLSSAPAAGNYTVTATVQPVPGEKDTSNNTMSFPVTFH